MAKMAKKAKQRAADAETTALARPSVSIARRLDLQLVEGGRVIAREYLRWLTYAEQAIRDKTYERLGFDDPEAYFEQHLGVAYRVVRKRLLINQALRRLPEAERTEAGKAFVEIGMQRAAIIAPVLGKAGKGNKPWREWVEDARGMTLAELQRAVNRVAKARKTKGEVEPQAPEDSADARWLRYSANVLHPDFRDEFLDVFSAGRSAFETESNLQVLMILCRSSANEVFLKARVRGWRPATEHQLLSESAVSGTA